MSVPPLFVMPKNTLFSLGLPSAENTFYQLAREVLIRQYLGSKEEGLNNTDAVVTHTDENTGGSRKGYYAVKDSITANSVDRDHINRPIEEKFFDALYRKMIEHLKEKQIWIRDSYVSIDSAHKLYIRSICEDPASDLFVYNMFLHPEQKELGNFSPGWYIIHVPSFSADPKVDGTRHNNFTIINLTKRVILIGGKAYNNEIKEWVLSMLTK